MSFINGSLQVAIYYSQNLSLNCINMFDINIIRCGLESHIDIDRCSQNQGVCICIA